MSSLVGFWKGKFTLGSDPNVLIAPWARQMKDAPLFRGPHTLDTQLVYKDNHFNITITEGEDTVLPYGGKPIIIAGDASITQEEVGMALYFELESMVEEGILEERSAIGYPPNFDVKYLKKLIKKLSKKASGERKESLRAKLAAIEAAEKEIKSRKVKKVKTPENAIWVEFKNIRDGTEITIRCRGSKEHKVVHAKWDSQEWVDANMDQFLEDIKSWIREFGEAESVFPCKIDAAYDFAVRGKGAHQAQGITVYVVKWKGKLEAEGYISENGNLYIRTDNHYTTGLQLSSMTVPLAPLPTTIIGELKPSGKIEGLMKFDFEGMMKGKKKFPYIQEFPFSVAKMVVEESSDIGLA